MTPMKTSELVETIKLQDEIIHQQAGLIVKLVNENAEQEAIINELLAGEEVRA